MTKQIHSDMQKMSIQTLYEVITNCRRENTLLSLKIAELAQYYVDCKFKGQYNA